MTVQTRLECVVPDCHYCEEPLSVIKGGPQVNGLHGECAELVQQEMEETQGPTNLIME